MCGDMLKIILGAGQGVKKGEDICEKRAKAINAKSRKTRQQPLWRWQIAAPALRATRAMWRQWPGLGIA
jgi:hypothetical protein